MTLDILPSTNHYQYVNIFAKLFLTFFTLILALILSGTNTFAVEKRYTLKAGPEELIFDSPITYDPDAYYWTFDLNGKKVGVITGGLGPGKGSGTYFTKPGIDPLKKPLLMTDLVKQEGIQSGDTTAFDGEGAWLKYIYTDGNGKTHGFYHAEARWTTGVEAGQSIAYIHYDNQQKRWIKPNYPNNEILRGYNGLNAADAFGFKDGQYLYLYYTEKPSKVSGRTDAQGKAIARATLDSKGEPGNWYKYFCQPNGTCGFTQPGLAGKVTFLRQQDGTVPLANRSWNTFANKYINITQSFNWHTSTDGYNWVKQIQPEIKRDTGYSYWYVNILGFDGSHEISGKQFYYYFVKFLNSNHLKRSLYRQKVDIIELIPGDANNDGKIDNGDFAILKVNFGKTGDTTIGNFNTDSIVDGLDYAIWFANYEK